MISIKNRLIAAAATVILAVTGFGIAGLSEAPPADLRLVINIPASRLDVYEHGARTRSYPISAGRREFATPAGSYKINSVIWNPWWHPPKSEWARDEKPAPPGPNNPMGRIKINFASLLYIHGTMYEEDLGIPASHGCVRIGDEHLKELARLIHKYRTPRVDPALLATLEQNRTMTRNFAVKPVPLEVKYDLVEVLDDKLVIHPDVYRSAGKDLRSEIITTLKKAGIEMSSRLEQRLSTLSKKRNATRLTVSLDSLTAGSAGD
jgi:murein L,D-transpeptidase YcbB/YkuD